ncbi:MAG: radical SAM protein [archaeon]
MNFPSLRLAITTNCNWKCPGCAKHGDSYKKKSEEDLYLEDFINVASAANKIGIKHFSITGGEPLLKPRETFSLANHIRNNLKNIIYLRLNTNGVLVSKYLEELKLFDKIKVNAEFHKNTDVFDLLKNQGFDVRINLMVGKYQQKKTINIIEYAEKNNIEVKLLDLTYYKDNIGENNFWEQNYTTLSNIQEKLTDRYGLPETVYAVGRFGNPMQVFKKNSKSPIILRRSDEEAQYVKECINCQDYMCQDGFCNLTIASDGQLKPCRPEGLSFVEPITHNDQKIEEKLYKILKIFQRTKRVKRDIPF